MSISGFKHRYWLWQQVMRQLNRRADLKRLVAWAERKRLPGPRLSYERQLDRTARTLILYKTQYPRLVRWAHRLHRLNALLNPPPRVWPQGSAAKYQLSTS